MTSLLRQIVAGPRAKHAETGLDLCYVTKDIIATSGPSQTYPQRAYRNPLDRLVAFLDARHGENWAIWEFRAEGTGYPDEAVYGRIRHYPWPDHHPPPFRMVPLIMASMRNWLDGGELEGGGVEPPNEDSKKAAGKAGEKKRVVVVHCKAGKGRSGSMATSYLISHCGWTPEDALARFTERRMRPNFGAGVSIPSQLRWVSYVDRWNKGGKKFVDREVEIVELHVWGLRHGVKVSVEGYIDDGRKIRVFHTFKASERFVVEGDAPGGAGVRDFVSDFAEGLLSPTLEDEEMTLEPELADVREDGTDTNTTDDTASNKSASSLTRSSSKKAKPSKTMSILRSMSKRKPRNTLAVDEAKFSSQPSLSSPVSAPPAASDDRSQSIASLPGKATTFAAHDEPGGEAVIFRPAQPIVVPNGDVNLALERRNRAPASMGLTMVTAVAHVWFNTFFEGNGPEQDGKPDDSGVFEIEWDRMDGIKGTSQRGTRAADRIAVVWRVPLKPDGEETGPTAEATPGKGTSEAKARTATPEVKVDEPGGGEAVPQMEAADWKGGNEEDPEGHKRLGLRAADPDSEDVSKASTVKSLDLDRETTNATEQKRDSIAGVKASGPEGGALDFIPDLGTSDTAKG